MDYVGGVDLGATNLRAAVAEITGEPVAVERRRTPRGNGGTAVASAVVETLLAAGDAAAVPPGALEAVGVGTLGPLDRAAGAVVRPPNLPGIERISLREAVTTVVDHDRVFVENDAVAGLVGERAAMADPPDNLVYLTLSTGIGAGVSVDGHVLRGRDGNAAEVGHLVVDPTGGRTCGCGGLGHWEAYCAGVAIPAFARDVAEETGMATALALDDPSLAAADVFAAAGDDPLADRVLERVTHYNAVGVAGLVHAYAPDCLAIGGAVALENRSLIIDPLGEDVGRYTMLPAPMIQPATHGREAVLQGALALAIRGGLDD